MMENGKATREQLRISLLEYWQEVAVGASEGEAELKTLNDELLKISMNAYCEASTTPALKKLLSSVGVFETSRESSRAFSKALSDASSLIEWYPNNVYDDLATAEKLENYCANLVGKERESQSNPSIFHSDGIIVGLFLLGPNRLYPEHAHPASEMWVILSGKALWKRGSEEWRVRKPGEYFIHTENQSHAMKTLDEPVFALWAWTGDLEQWAKWTEEE